MCGGSPSARETALGLCRPSADWARPTHTLKGSVCSQFTDLNVNLVPKHPTNCHPKLTIPTTHSGQPWELRTLVAWQADQQTGLRTAVSVHPSPMAASVSPAFREMLFLHPNSLTHKVRHTVRRGPLKKQSRHRCTAPKGLSLPRPRAGSVCGRDRGLDWALSDPGRRWRHCPREVPGIEGRMRACALQSQ